MPIVNLTEEELESLVTLIRMDGETIMEMQKNGDLTKEEAKDELSLNLAVLQKLNTAMTDESKAVVKAKLTKK